MFTDRDCDVHVKQQNTRCIGVLRGQKTAAAVAACCLAVECNHTLPGLALYNVTSTVDTRDAMSVPCK